MSDATDVVLRELRALGMTFPGAHGKSPWPGHDDLVVKDRTFAYLSLEGQPFSISFKLPYTSHEALTLPCAKPKGYGLGKSGWVTFEQGKDRCPRSSDSRIGSTRVIVSRRRENWSKSSTPAPSRAITQDLRVGPH